MAEPRTSLQATTAPLIDHSAIEPIMRMTGIPVMRRIVDAFWSATGEMIGSLRAAIESGDTENIRKAAHSLKGAASNVGAGRVASIVGSIERAAPAEAETLFPDLEQALEDTRPALDAFLREAA
jgi:HPt (histidine-containing phosphotransfer) domain-containing protein